MKVAILSGSVYGTAEEVARHAESLLKQAGIEAWHNPRATLDEVKAFAPEAFLVVTSTTGMGELPDNLQPLYQQIRDQLPAWGGLPGGVIGLGDSSYGDTYCAGGEQARELFAELGIREVLPMLRIDASESVTPEQDAEPWIGEFVGMLQKSDRPS
ncbi:flavodoxin [Pseudomonas sp. G34]|uniref:flavodoxin n=1 Tax=Pseudomonas sp. G34 TaxID=3059083 RepID=UPI0028088F35|nr:flavodoxin [Pseudomonas sp. G34]MDQ7983802.1 flavodoxin [Pseudomonas sp. G34]